MDALREAPQDQQSASNDLLCVTTTDGKYTVVLPKDGSLKALRYGEEWRDCCGDGLIYALAAELTEAREKIEAAKNCLVCLPIGDAVEICENTYSILNT